MSKLTERQQVRKVFNRCLDRMEKGDLDRLDNDLMELDVHSLATPVMLAWLAITTSVAHKLPSRAFVYAIFRQRLIIEINDPRYVDNLLQGLHLYREEGNAG